MPPPPPPRAAEATQIVRATPQMDGPVDLLKLLGIEDPLRGEFNLDRAWQDSGYDDLYRVPIGLDDRGQPYHLDFKRVLAGVGIHGKPGSGTSELLRTILLGIGATHSPLDINVICISADNSHAFHDVSDLPHISGFYPSAGLLSAAAKRVAHGLDGELRRRLGVLGTLRQRDFTSYQRFLRYENWDFPRMPLIVLLIDELPRIMCVNRELAEALLSVFRTRGRSGIVFAYSWTRDQPDESPELNGPARILLDDPSNPGRGHVDMSRIFTGDPKPIRAAYAGDPHDLNGPSRAKILAQRIESSAPFAEPVVSPPLGRPLDLNELLPDLQPDEERGLQPKGRPLDRRLRATIGRLDDTGSPRHDPLELDLRERHVAIVGRPRSGKSSAVQTLLLSLALTNTPREIHLHCIDFGGGSLSLFRGLPHTRVVAPAHDLELAATALQSLDRLLTERAELFDRHGIDSIEEFRGRAEEFTDTAADHVLVVDGWFALEQDTELSRIVLQLAHRGAAYGIHLVVTANRWAELPDELRDLIDDRIELRLADPRTTTWSTELAVAVPNDQPGLGQYQNLHCQIATPALNIDASLDHQVHARRLVERIAEAWPHERPAQLRPSDE